MFEGSLLHGVLPAYTATERDQPRLTLMVVRKTPLFEPRLDQNDLCFAKTGSGQTQGDAETARRFPMQGWWDTDVTVEASPEIAFPHAAMVTPPAATTPWLQPLTDGLGTVQKALKQSEKKQNKKMKKKDKKKQQHQEDGQGATADSGGVEVPPRFVSPVWESVAPPPTEGSSGTTSDNSSTRQPGRSGRGKQREQEGGDVQGGVSKSRKHLHLADATLFSQSDDGGGGGGDVIPPHFPGGGGLQFVVRKLRAHVLVVSFLFAT